MLLQARAQLLAGLRMVLVMTLVLGLGYPLVVTAVSQLAFGDEADGSLIEGTDGTVVGSSLVGQSFEGDRYFEPRPSAAGDGYDGASSSASNLGPTNETLLGEVGRRVAAYRVRNGLDGEVEVPVDAVTASGSGLDPHISVANARLQAPRVATARGLGVDRVDELVDSHTAGRSLGFLGEEVVNVLELNLALDAEAAP